MATKIITTLICALLTFSQFAMAQNDFLSFKKNKLKPFVNLSGSRSFKKDNGKYFGIYFGLKSNCKYRIGLGYTWLRGNYKSDLYPVDPITYPDAKQTTKTNIRLFSIFFSPVVVQKKRFNISIPIHVGISGLKSRYKTSTFNYTKYYSSTPMFARVGADFKFRIYHFLKLGLKLGYQVVLTDFAVGKDAFNTPYIGLGLSIGGICK
ncbi:MAG: hypothetical protein HRT71_18135 [Flavobacteriales bacterium]|nr:hypothetical protein [Flavobacteriales bacterium]